MINTTRPSHRVTRLSLCIAGLSIPVPRLTQPSIYQFILVTLQDAWLGHWGQKPSPSKPLLHPDSTNLASVLFTRRYWRHHCCFLFLPLLICLSYGSSLTHFKFNCQYDTNKCLNNQKFWIIQNISLAKCYKTQKYRLRKAIFFSKFYILTRILKRIYKQLVVFVLSCIQRIVILSS